MLIRLLNDPTSELLLSFPRLMPFVNWLKKLKKKKERAAVLWCNMVKNKTGHAKIKKKKGSIYFWGGGGGRFESDDCAFGHSNRNKLSY